MTDIKKRNPEFLEYMTRRAIFALLRIMTHVEGSYVLKDEDFIKFKAKFGLSRFKVETTAGKILMETPKNSAVYRDILFKSHDEAMDYCKAHNIEYQRIFDDLE